MNGAPVLVADLKQSLEGLNERTLETTFGGMSLDKESRTLRVAEGQEFRFDEKTERAISQYLGISKSYLAKCPPDLKAHNINHWLQAKPNTAAVIEALGDNLLSIHKPGLVILPVQRVAEVIERTLDPSYEIVNLIRNETKFHLDIMTPHSVEVPVDNRIADRTQGEHAVGDITHGGIRILSNPTEADAPSVMTYLHRLWCTNGSTSPEAEGEIKLKGRTVDDVIIELEGAAQRVLGQLDQKLADYADLANRRPPGSPIKFARQLGAEYKIPDRVMKRILDRVEILPEDSTLYDIQQVFTQMANANIPYAMMTRLQTMAGDMAFDTDHIVHRCGTCERLLPE